MIGINDSLSPPLLRKVLHSSSDNDALAAGVGASVLILRGAAGARVVTVTASRTTTVELDAVTLASDTVALTGASNRAWRAVVAEGAGGTG